MVVDWTPPSNASLPLGSLQLVNHGCSPDCVKEHIETESTLLVERVVLRSICTNGGTFWRRARSLQQRPRIVKMVHCPCAALSRCPSNYAMMPCLRGRRPLEPGPSSICARSQLSRAPKRDHRKRRRSRARGFGRRHRSPLPQRHKVLSIIQKNFLRAALLHSYIGGGLVARSQFLGWAGIGQATNKCCLEGR